MGFEISHNLEVTLLNYMVTFWWRWQVILREYHKGKGDVFQCFSIFRCDDILNVYLLGFVSDKSWVRSFSLYLPLPLLYFLSSRFPSTPAHVRKNTLQTLPDFLYNSSLDHSSTNSEGPCQGPVYFMICGSPSKIKASVLLIVSFWKFTQTQN